MRILSLVCFNLRSLPFKVHKDLYIINHIFPSFLWLKKLDRYCKERTYEGWNFNSGNYLSTTDTK